MIPKVLVGAVLVAAGLAKIRSVESLAQYLAAFRLFPAQGNQILAVVLPWWEMAGGLLLILGLWEASAAIFSAILFGCFAISTLLALVNGISLDCSCFGEFVVIRSTTAHVMLDLLGICLSILSYRSARNRSAKRAMEQSSARAG